MSNSMKYSHHHVQLNLIEPLDLTSCLNKNHGEWMSKLKHIIKKYSEKLRNMGQYTKQLVWFLKNLKKKKTGRLL